MERLYRIVSSLAGESKQGGYMRDLSQYQFCCPWCAAENGGSPDGKYNLEVNFSLGKYHCWKCESKGKISGLIKRWGTRTQLGDYYSEIKSIRESKQYDLKSFEDSQIEEKDESLLFLPKGFRKMDLKSCPNNRAKNYLLNRGFTQKMVDRFNIGYTGYREDDKSMSNRIIIPSYNENGFLEYWVGRDFTGNPKRVKYKNAKADRKTIVFQQSLVIWDADIILVEGAIDCLYYPNSIALMGKVLTGDSELFRQLYERSNANITICLDADTDISETKRIYSLLNRGRLRGKVWYIRMTDDKDFGDAYASGGKQRIVELLKDRKQFSDFEMVL